MLTILTPTYNRIDTLPRLYQSLLAQRNRNFEWLIVDDGSTDDTASWVAALEHEADFPIRLIRQDNGGKHVALNTGVVAAHGDWVFIVDSDDLLTNDATQVVADALGNIAGQQSVVGLCFRRGDLNGRLLGRECHDMPMPFASTPTRVGRMVQGDLAYIFHRDTMALLPFPVISGEKFVPELYIWNKISDQGQIWFYLDRIVYWCEYLDDGYTRNFAQHLKRHPRGFLLFYWAQIAREPHWLGKIKAMVRSTQCLIYCLCKTSHGGRE
ncbi:glycosyltransferase family A protein [Pollutimonas harenae]|uniref:Glycosyltransferase family 2 protein n=1 Tax=Pollutimonas harenae TaxID=657015 RepID=A0A853GZ59_9BURK|nr:glycosyltransferase family 2 protein [Pollutimonas harenae]NYT84345.1 glycosyltransferase family 2 protein [Pollutimonas harenae]TEA73254.1 glycosyltransferase family 2 protein [Pollutimonas harenae]